MFRPERLDQHEHANAMCLRLEMVTKHHFGKRKATLTARHG